MFFPVNRHIPSGEFLPRSSYALRRGLARTRTGALALTLALVVLLLTVACAGTPSATGDARAEAPASGEAKDTTSGDVSSNEEAADVLDMREPLPPKLVEPTLPMPEATEGSVTIRVGATDGQTINRALFSLVNYQAVVAGSSGMGEEILSRLGLSGTHQRIATDPPAFEPRNDNNDPHVANDAAFNPDNLILGEDLSADGFMQDVRERGMEPVLLLAYNLPWLSNDGNVTNPPDDPEEWAEFAVEAVASLIDDPENPAVRYVEIWNEPDTQLYWKGTQAEFSELFNTVARRIHERFPGVQVGGPAALNYTSRWVLDFIEDTKDHLDFFVYHSYNEEPERLVARARNMADYLKEQTGRTIPLMITESDNWNLSGPDKWRYLLDRQLRLLDFGDDMLSFHHFQASAFLEGSRRFGMVFPDGRIIQDNYWPYWVFRDLSGDRRAVTVVGEESITSAIRTIASEDEGKLTLFAYLPNDAGVSGLSGTIELPVPERFVGGSTTVSTIGSQAQGVVDVQPIPEAPTVSYDLPIVAGHAYAITMYTKEAAPAAWVDVKPSRTEILVGENFQTDVTLLNTSGQDVTVQLSLLGLPQDWQIDLTEGSAIYELKAGQAARTTFRVEAGSPTGTEGAAMFAFAGVRVPGRRATRFSSIPQGIRSLAPVRISTEPNRLYTTQGYESTFVVVLENTFSDDVSGQLALSLPEGMDYSGPREVTVPQGSTERVQFKLQTDQLLDPSEQTATVEFSFGERVFTHTVPVLYREFETGLKSMPLDVSSFFNSDGFSFSRDYGDFRRFGGRFCLAGEFAPEPGIVNYLGVDFIFPDLSDGKDNLIETHRQRIGFEPGRYDRVYFLTTTVNSDKEEEVVFHYEDGTQQRAEFLLTDWCVAPKHGEVPVYKAPYRHTAEGVLEDAQPQIFAVWFDVDGSKNLTAIELPDRYDLYVAAISLVQD